MSVSIDELNEATSISFSDLAIKEGLTPRKIIHEIKEIALSDLKNHLTIDEGGAVIAKPLTEIGKRSRAIKKIKEKCVISESKDGDVLYKTSTVEYELHDKLDALDQAMTLLGMKNKKLDVKHQGNIIVDTGIRRPMDEPGWTGIVAPGATSKAD